MIIRLTAILLMTALAMPAGEPAMAKASKMGSGSVVIVRLTSGEEVRGRLMDVTPEAVTVMTATAAEVGERVIAAGEVKSLRAPTNRTRDILAGLGGAYLILYAIMVPLVLVMGG
ncbi:MAG: hypothetical protein IH602_20205 [Bryobacteraceae bacterium]|nr:hypothetical protein [Bryobacteraceae bacterium]